MNETIALDISENASTPKYKQIVNSIIASIEAGHIKYGQKLPSINQLSFDYTLARDTIEKAYNELKEQGIIESAKGKGYYVKNSNPRTKLKVLVLFNKLSSYKRVIYNTMAHQMTDKAELDLFIYHCNYELFKKILTERLKGYNYYIIMPYFISFEVDEFQDLLKQIHKDKIIILDHLIEGIEHYNGLVYQDFKMDIYHSLVEAQDLLKKYDKVILVFPDNHDYPYPKDIIAGFRRFCGFESFEFDILSEIAEGFIPEPNAAYILIEENDLINMIKIVRQRKLKVGQDLGILTYNETPLKEILEDGISVITTDFEKMGATTADMMLNNRPVQVKNDFRLIIRKSL